MNNISSFLVPFFATMREEKYLWAVAHGWEGLPEYTRHDVDLYVEKSGVKKTLEIINNVAMATDWRVFRICKKSIYTACLLYRDLGEKGFKFLQFDLFSGSVTKGIPSKPDPIEWLNKRWLNASGIWCANRGLAGASVLLKELIQNGVVERASRHSQIVDAVNSSREDFKAAVLEFTGDERLAERLCSFAEESKWSSLAEMAPTLKKCLPKLSIKNFVTFVKWSLASIKVRLFPFFKLFIVFIGPDGCGKTTIADYTEQYLLLNPFSDKVRIHSGFSVLPRLRDIYAFVARLFGRRVKFRVDPAPGTKGMGMIPPFPLWKALLYIIYNGINAILWWIPYKRIYPYFTLVLADRYFYDYYYMRGYAKCPQWIKRFFAFLIPAPDLIFYMDRDAEQIYAQKPELDICEIRRQQKIIMETMSRDKRFYKVDASHGIEHTVDNVIAIIRDYMRGCIK